MPPFRPDPSSLLTPAVRSTMNVFWLLTLISLGHDLWIWYNSADFPFEFAALGHLSKTYIPDIHNRIVAFLGVDLFNTLLTPILMLPATIAAGGCALIVAATGIVIQKIKLARRRKEKTFRVGRKA